MNEHLKKAKSRLIMESKSVERLDRIKQRKSLVSRNEMNEPSLNNETEVSEKAKKAMETFGLKVMRNSQVNTPTTNHVKKRNSDKTNIFSLTDANHDFESRMKEKLHITEKNKEIIHKNQNKYPKDLLYMRYRYDRDCKSIISLNRFEL